MLDIFFFQDNLLLILVAFFWGSRFLLREPLDFKALPRRAPQALWNVGLVFLAYQVHGQDFFCWLALSLVLAGLCLPLLFRWDQSRNFSWSGHYVLFVLQSLALALSPLAFYRGLQGPLPLDEISYWTQGRQGLLVLAYVAMLIYQCWPAQWALPDWLRARLQPREPYVYGRELYRWLESFPEHWLWQRPWEFFLDPARYGPGWRCGHRLVDFGLRHLCPLFFLGASLAGLLFHRDASWMLVTQPLQVFSFLYLTFFELLLLLRRAKILGLQGWLKVKDLDP